MEIICKIFTKYFLSPFPCPAVHRTPLTRRCCGAEIYRIVSQKSALAPGEEDTVIRPSNLETVTVKPTVNTEAVRRQCCSS